MEYPQALITVLTLAIGCVLLGYLSSEDTYMQKGAMEVYKGNTIIEYKTVDGVKVDSCVIFKKFKNNK